MKRRIFLQAGAGVLLGLPLRGALRAGRLDDAAGVLSEATKSGLVRAATIHVVQQDQSFSAAFGEGISGESMFLLGSISKPISVAAVMSLYDEGHFSLDDRVQKFVPAFRGDGRDAISIRQLLTHVSGLPDQLPENARLRSSHAPLSEFVEHAIRTPLLFAPGSQYGYSSMAILLASHIAELISEQRIHDLVQKRVFDPLKMSRSALGLGRFQLDDFVRAQTERAAPESGAGDPEARNWDWNSLYWRRLGAPWGTAHASAADVATFLGAFLNPSGKALRPDTARMMVSNQNRPGIKPRGLGFNIGVEAGSPGCSEQTFGHTGSTGTLCWADPGSRTICVVLTSLPGRAVTPHPREQAAAQIARAAR